MANWKSKRGRTRISAAEGRAGQKEEPSVERRATTSHGISSFQKRASFFFPVPIEGRSQSLCVCDAKPNRCYEASRCSCSNLFELNGYRIPPFVKLATP
jgi:hypothetical protein